MLIILYGKTGSGKSTIAKELARKYNFKLAVSATSREKRKGEKDGVHYWFKTKDEMFDMYYNKHELAELNTYMGNYYGMPINEINGDNIKLAVMEPNGIKVLKEAGYDIIPIYINVNLDDQKIFLKNDATRYPEETKARLEKGDSEFTQDVIDIAEGVIENSYGKDLMMVTYETKELIKKLLNNRDDT